MQFHESQRQERVEIDGYPKTDTLSILKETLNKSLNKSESKPHVISRTRIGTPCRMNSRKIRKDGHPARLVLWHATPRKVLLNAMWRGPAHLERGPLLSSTAHSLLSSRRSLRPSAAPPAPPDSRTRIGTPCRMNSRKIRKDGHPARLVLWHATPSTILAQSTVENFDFAPCDRPALRKSPKEHLYQNITSCFQAVFWKENGSWS